MRFPMEALSAVLDYLWEDEEDDYREHPSSKHIFLQLRRLRAWLEAL